MTVTTFDTHAAVKALTKAGVAPAQAEAITDTVRDAVTEGVATKADIARLEDKIARVEDKMDTKADRADLYRAMFGLAAFIAAVAAVAVGLMQALG